ncbi:hypothetical protein ADUPG1_008977 [Aduncisulcus paluster]|uniref:Thioredoxin domain-containing protein n=1 Tax=Aduncisulcus paluster TaxID=2918883 RepID=A0ABQ5KTW3_9EUKA|nr:hypothetical protein ADUPG1_008977 [Aduncisulcus paluster]|eukprot:gnl/Carplike_NY0171/1587_a2145_1015.p1 GENE.gnl/Carplike_NY0171/1587_a2145_1015~~gnl/Carplike_NY0171/1587_a2145_1015.p1  ORF type:complete len:341 (-),score=75.27 gnl/Carplike_NY0171/1587_a2145_1015:22-1044(-)
MHPFTLLCVILALCGLVLADSSSHVDFVEAQNDKASYTIFFHDPTLEKSIKALEVFEDAVNMSSNEGVKYYIVDVTTEENSFLQRQEFLPEFPQIFAMNHFESLEIYPFDFMDTFKVFEFLSLKFQSTDSSLVQIITEDEDMIEIKELLLDSNAIIDEDKSHRTYKKWSGKPFLLFAYSSQKCDKCKSTASMFYKLSHRNYDDVAFGMIDCAGDVYANNFCGNLNLKRMPQLILYIDERTIQYDGAETVYGVEEWLAHRMLLADVEYDQWYNEQIEAGSYESRAAFEKKEKEADAYLEKKGMPMFFPPLPNPSKTALKLDAIDSSILEIQILLDRINKLM